MVAMVRCTARWSKAEVIEAVTGESNEFRLWDGNGPKLNITHFPHRFFNETGTDGA